MANQPSVFIAYSVQDIKNARLVRNLFEERQYDTLLLKLSQQMTQDDLEKLIQQEIKVRDWVVVVVSENSASSKWVSFEKAYANLRGKPVFSIELEQCSHLTGQQLRVCLEQQVTKISRKIRIFMSYAHKDHILAEQLTQDLQQEGYQVWHDQEQLKPGTNWQHTIEDAIKETLEKGYMVVLMSENSIASPYVVSELRLGLQYPGRIIPCLVNPRPNIIPRELVHIQYLDFTNRLYKQAFQQLIQVLQQDLT